MATEDSGTTQSFGCAGSTETNQSATFSSSEDTQLEAAREAWFGQKRTFERWLVIGRGVRILRQRADRLHGRQTFARLMAEQGFKMDGPKPERQFEKATVTRLIRVIDHESEVIAWHKKLAPFQQIAWASPDAIIRHCPIFANPNEGPKEPSAFELLKRANIALQEENHRLMKTSQDGDTWSAKDDTPKDIALAMIGQLEGFKGKAERVFKEGATILSARRGKAATKTTEVINHPTDSKRDLGSILNVLVEHMNAGGMTEKDIPTLLAAKPPFDDLDLVELGKRLQDVGAAWKRAGRKTSADGSARAVDADAADAGDGEPAAAVKLN
jgi:hypothetical protein